MEWIKSYKEQVEFAIDAFFSERYKREDVTAEEKKLRDAILFAVKSSRSERMHPILAMVVYEEVLGLTADTAVPVFTGLEFLYLGMLLHSELIGIKKETNTDVLYSKKYGSAMTILVGDALINIGLECLAKGAKIELIQEALRGMDDSGMIRGMTRDILLNHINISEAEYIAMHDEELARFISSSFLVGALFASAAPEILIDQLKRFAVFLCRIYQVKKDIDIYEASLSFPPSDRPKNVVDFLGIEKTKALYENLQFELLKMTQNFQSSKFSDLIDLFSRGGKIDGINT